MDSQVKLILFCGKMGAGKSTLAIRKANELNAVFISEDDWLSTLYPDTINTFDDFIKHSNLLKPLIRNHAINILQTGTNVVMDFPANTKRQRAWFKQLVAETTAQVELFYLKASDVVCLQQIAQRQTEQPDRAAFDTEEVFHHVTKFFEEPDESEGLYIKRTYRQL